MTSQKLLSEKHDLFQSCNSGDIYSNLELIYEKCSVSLITNAIGECQLVNNKMLCEAHLSYLRYSYTSLHVLVESRNNGMNGHLT